MALTSDQKSSSLFKQSLGVAETNTSRDFFEESIKGRSIVLNDQIWIQSSEIPATAPSLADGATEGVVQYFQARSMTAVPGVSNSFYLADLVDSIPFNFGNGSYNYTLTNASGTAIPFGQGDWLVNNAAGTLTFYGTVPSGMPPKISFYKYIGSKGAGGEDAVSSVNGQVGAVVLDTDDVEEGDVNLYFTDERAKAAAVSDSITDGVTDVAPSQNAVRDALDAIETSVSGEIQDAIDEIALDILAQNELQKEPTGFANRTESVVTFDDSLRTITVAPTGASFDVYIKGKKYTKELPETISIGNESGNHYVFYNPSGTLTSTNIFDSSLFLDNAMVSIVYWNTDINTHTYFAEERHGLIMDGATHSYLHTTFGARYMTGLALQNFSVNGNGSQDAHAQFTADSGSIRDEDLLLTITAQSQIPILYRQNQLWRKKAADSYPLIYSGTAGYTGANGRIPFNEYVDGAWELTEANNSAYVLVHLFATNDKENPVVGIQGTAQHTSISDARNAASTEISSLSGLPFAEFVAIGSVMFKTASYANVPNAVVEAIDVAGTPYVDFRGTQLYTPAGTATTHSLLSGLSGDDHPQYLTEARADLRYAQIVPGEIGEQAFSIVNNQETPANITGLAFDNAEVRSFDALLSVSINATTPLYESIKLTGIQKASGWELNSLSIGDNTGILLSIDATGQVQYISMGHPGFVSGTIKFKAQVTTV